MPLYEYRSESGKSIEEIYGSWKDAPAEIVQDGETYTRVVSAPAFYFVGSFSGNSTKVKSTETKATPREIEQHARSARKHRKKQEARDLDKAIEQAASEIAV